MPRTFHSCVVKMLTKYKLHAVSFSVLYSASGSVCQIDGTAHSLAHTII